MLWNDVTCLLGKVSEDMVAKQKIDLRSIPLFPENEAPIIGLVLPLPPSANRYWRMGGGRIYVSEEARSYREEVSLICYQQGIKPMTGTLSISLNVYRAQRRGDLDNSLKIVLDSLKHRCYADDDQIVQIIANRYDDKRNPRLEVTVHHFVPRPSKVEELR